jgi:2-desacetyl-2-hydroxyethyl bacteriochlorophyllide A dehydrogenase
MTASSDATSNPGVVFPMAGQVEFQEQELTPPGPDEVLVRTRRSMISPGTELTILSGQFPDNSAWATYGRFPFLVGYSAAVEVIEIGSEVRSVKVGDLVAAPTPHVRFATVAASSVYPVRDERLALDHIPFVSLGQVVMNGVRRAHLGWGETVVVFGAGILGQLAVRFCRLVGARPVIAVDPSSNRLACLPKEEGIVTIEPTSTNLRDRVADVTRGRMADVVFEVTGIPSLIPEEFQVMKASDGRFVVLSSPSGPTWFDFHDLCNSPSHTIIGAHNRSHPVVETAANPWTLQRDAELLLDLVASKEVELEPLITHRLPYSAACDAYRSLLKERTHGLAIILNWDET